jgi:hypothetical protein
MQARMAEAMSPHRNRPTWRAAGLTAAGWLAAVAGGQAAEAVADPTILATHIVPAETLPGGAGVVIGGLSDLFVTTADAEGIVAWTLTDRGPNGSVPGPPKRRTLVAADFAPTAIKLRLPAVGTPTVEAVLPLAGVSGTPLSGRPNGVGRDEMILDAATGQELPPDPNGVDTEGIVVLADGSFWACEEYRPSLLKVSAEGRVLERHVPEGVALPGADTRVIADLPAAYGDRRDNRGFEGLALSADGRSLFVILQSPLDHPTKKAGKQTGNVRLLVVDASTGSPVAEHVYRLGDPADPHWAAAGAPPEDGKLCCLAALADGTLAVLEQDETGLLRLYRADPRAATDTLPRTRRGDGPALETIADLAAAEIAPLVKTLLVDLGPLVPRLRADVFDEETAGRGGPALKIEGLAVLDAGRVLLVNDNDFAVPEGTGPQAAKTCLWVVGLPVPLPAGPAHTGLTPGL